MKRIILLILLALIAAVGFGCNHTSKGVTHLGRNQPALTKTTTSSESNPEERANALPNDEEATRSITRDGDTILPDIHDIADFQRDTELFKGNIVYFGYDRSALDPAEVSKMEPISVYLKNNHLAKLLIEGHCDERGTEEYNRSLGDRRALTAREYLIASGISTDRLYTRSWGEDRPLEKRHDEQAWSKNRRGEFVVLLPNQTTSASSQTQPPK